MSTKPDGKPAGANEAVPLSVLALVGIGASLLMLYSANFTNGFLGFPLDDSWIHLQFARNLHDFGKFSYFKGEMVTSGSTSPIYVVVLAAGFWVMHNEFILSYALGIAFLIGSSIFAYRMMRRTIPVMFALPGAALLLLEPRLQWAAVSGMETTMFIFMLVATLYYYILKNGVYVGVLAGLLVWVRPEGLLFLMLLTLDFAARVFIRRRRRKESSEAWALAVIRIAPVGILLYFAFNLLLSGSFFPNTLAAKLAYYSSPNTSFFAGAVDFFSAGHMTAIAVFACLGGIATLRDTFRERVTGNIVLVLWPVLLCILFGLKLPHLYQEGRYLMPALPFLIMLAVVGVLSVAAFVKKHLIQHPSLEFSLTAIPLLFIAGQETFATERMAATYAVECKYIADRQVRTAKWLHDTLPVEARVATHDVGAIGFYSGRRVVDMIGLVSPAMIPNIGSFDGLSRFLSREHVTHLVLLRNWFEVANQTPLFSTDENNPEIMEVFQYQPGTTTFVPQGLSRVVAAAEAYLRVNNPQAAKGYLELALRDMPGNARAHCDLGLTFLRMGRNDAARKELELALQLRPDYPEARVWLASLEE